MAATFEGSQRIPEKDKKFLTIDGMDKTMAQMLANKCNDITKGFMVDNILKTIQRQWLSIALEIFF